MSDHSDYKAAVDSAYALYGAGDIAAAVTALRGAMALFAKIPNSGTRAEDGYSYDVRHLVNVVREWSREANRSVGIQQIRITHAEPTDG